MGNEIQASSKGEQVSELLRNNFFEFNTGCKFLIIQFI